MARRKKRSTTRRHRNRMGAMKFNANSNLVKFGSIALGYLMGDSINTGIDGMVPATAKSSKNYGKIAAGAQVGIGSLLAFKKSGKKSLILTVAGGVLAGAGLKRGIAAFTPPKTSGYGAVPVLNGYGQVPVLGKRINGYTPNQSLTGYTPNQSLTGNKPHLTTMGNSSGSGRMRND